MDMSFPRDEEVWGSPLTDIDPEDSVSNTMVGQEVLPRGMSSALDPRIPRKRNQTQILRSQEHQSQRKSNPLPLECLNP
jgi:hypothetical protein